MSISGTVEATTVVPYNPPACRVYHNANQSLTNNTLTALAFNSERYDTDTMHDTVTNNSRITINTAGLYLLTLSIQFAADTDYTQNFAAFRVDGATYIAQDASPGMSDGRVAIATVYKFSATQYVEAIARQINTSAGANDIIVNAQYTPEFTATWLGIG